MKLGINLLNDIESNTDSSMNIENAVRNLDKPLLIIHGEEDLTVLPTEAEMIYNWSNKKITELVKIKNTGHTFGIVHPFENPTIAFNKVIKETENFLLKLNN
jgi:pimeloyl-ACP methyl ester carboxylesterase